MRRLLSIDRADCRIEILSPTPNCRFRLDDGPDYQAHVENPEPNVYSILLDGHVYEAAIEETAEGAVVTIEGHRFEIELRDPRAWTGKPGGAPAEGTVSITAPMPGKVVRVLVAPGQRVEAGQGLIVVEAMKMQNELKAPRPGQVLTVPTKEGATVLAAEVLATIE
jgi:biotin carboxyl carrier protein